MSATEVGGVQSVQFLSERPLVESGPADGSFGTWFARELESVNQQLQLADSNVRQLAVGGTDNLHQVMLSVSKAKLQFELVLQVRNKLLEGYQEVMRMQV